MRQRCYRCFRPISLCFCEAIPQIENQTNVLILQHVGERFHPFNTARIVRNALKRCDLIVDHNLRFASQSLPIQPNAGLLYPSSDAILLDDVPADQRPDQLVIIDGTWHQAKTIVRDVPQLGNLPCYRLSPSSPGQYRIRREPDAQSLSTLEATTAALRALEPETEGFEKLVSAFNEMVENQLQHPANLRNMWRQKKSSGSRPRHIPRVLLDDLNRIVVAYGESTPGQNGQRNSRPIPLNWFARRLGTNEQFSACLKPDRVVNERALEHMQVGQSDLDAGITRDEFVQQWNQFFGKTDRLVVYHQKTFQLLRNLGVLPDKCITLKAVFSRWHAHLRSLEDLMGLENLDLPAADGKTRAAQRVEMAISLVERIRSQHLE